MTQQERFDVMQVAIDLAKLEWEKSESPIALQPLVERWYKFFMTNIG